jgi:hypothetical protein
MKVYYIIEMHRYMWSIGSFNKHKMEMMYRGKDIYECDISEFKGHLLSSEYID